MVLASAVALALTAASAATPIKLAAPGLTLVGMDEKAGVFFVDYLAQQFRTQGVSVTTQSQIAAVIGLERQKQLLGCGESSSECLAELAGALGVDGVLSGSIARTGSGAYVINLNIVAALDGRSMGSASARVPNDDALLDWLTAASRELAPRLVQQLGKGSAPSAELPMPPPPQVVTAAPAPTAPAPAAANGPFAITKWIAAGVGVAGLATGGLFYGSAASLRGELDNDSLPIASRSELNAHLAEIGGRQQLAAVTAGVGLAALATSALLFVLDRPPAVQVTLVPGAGAVAFSWELP